MNSPCRYTKVGYAGNPIPSAVFPTAIAYRSNVGVEEVSQRKKRNDGLYKSVEDLDYLVGENAFGHNNYIPTCPIQHGIIQDWNSMEKIFDGSALWKMGLFLVVAGLILHLFNYSDLVTNIIMSSCFVLQCVQAILVTDNHRYRDLEIRCCIVYLAILMVLFGVSYGYCRHFEPHTKRTGTNRYAAVNKKDWQQLWKTFFDTIAIDARKNQKLQSQNIPKRFWADTIELAENAAGLSDSCKIKTYSATQNSFPAAGR